MKWLVLGVVSLWLGVMAYQVYKPLPEGVGLAWPERFVPAESVRFLADRTYINADGQRIVEQEIFDEALAMIAGAQRYVLVDMFLFNDFQGETPEETRTLAFELTEALLAAHERGVEVTLVSDPLNTVYGGVVSPEFTRLREAGVRVVVTDLRVLRDSNPLYSSLWRMGLQWWGNSSGGGWMPHPFDARKGKVSIRSWLTLLNFKANHRKVVVADKPQTNGTVKMQTLVTSANPHDGSSAHGNVALVIEDAIWQDAVASEQAVGAFSEDNIPGIDFEVADEGGEVSVQLLTEGAIAQRVVELLDSAGEGDSLDMAMFYLSERRVVVGLKEAAARGVAIRLVLDPNKDAFGRVKNGVPNRPVADELVTDSGGDIEIRWCDTHGEQCHSKLVVMESNGRYYLTAGSANLTRRNVGDYNLETNVLVAADEESEAIREARTYFDEIWENKDGRTYTADYAVYAEDNWVKMVMYRVQEATGLSSF